MNADLIPWLIHEVLAGLWARLTRCLGGVPMRLPPATVALVDSARRGGETREEWIARAIRTQVGLLRGLGGPS